MSEISIRYAAAHLLRRETLTLSQALLQSHELVDEYLEGYFEAAMASRHRRAARFVGSNLRDAVAGGFESPDAFLEASRRLAERLFDVVGEDRRISISVFVMCLFDTDEGSMVGIFKLDPVDGLTPMEHERQGQRVVDFEVARDVMPTSDEALQKSAIVPGPDHSMEFDLWAIDAQSRGRDVAKFFLSDFLEADYALTDFDRTKRFVRAVHMAKRELPDDTPQEEVLSIDATLQAALRGTRIDADEFVEQVAVSDASREVLRESFEEHLPDVEFDVDREVADRALRKRIFKGDHGLKVEAPTEHYDELVTVEKNDGVFTVTIKTRKWEEQV